MISRTFTIGQRVRATFAGEAPSLGVVSGPDSFGSVPVQFEPCGAHFLCSAARVSCYGDAGGWTDREYRTAREASRSCEHAASVENERRAKYPGAAFSAYRGRDA